MTTRQVQLGTLAYTTIEDDAKLSTVGDLSLFLQLGDDPRQVSYRWRYG